MVTWSKDESRQIVQEAYGGVAPKGTQVADNLYSQEDLDYLPWSAREMALGLGNPLAYADLKPGEVVLDLGSGGGVDTLLAALRVGPTGQAIGLDMTQEMLAKAEENARALGAHNVTFTQGYIEDIPLPDASVDVVISNGVINLSTEKGRLFSEVYRVLKPGGSEREVHPGLHRGYTPARR